MANLYINLECKLSDGSYTITSTNIKPREIDNILTEYIRTQRGKGRDKSKPIKRAVYHIGIEIDLSDDTFYTKSDTGNKSLTTGIIVYSIKNWKLKTKKLKN